MLTFKRQHDYSSTDINVCSSNLPPVEFINMISNVRIKCKIYKFKNKLSVNEKDIFFFVFRTPS